MMLLIDIFEHQYGLEFDSKKDYIDLHNDKIDGWKALDLLNKIIKTI